MELLPFNLIISVLAGVLSLLAAVFTQWLSVIKRKERDLETEEIKQIAKVIEADVAARKSAVLERATEKFPAGLTSEQFSLLLERVTSNQLQGVADQPAHPAVENLISGYHEQALSQARAQFWFSVVAATVGFVWIIYAGAQINDANFASVSKILPGVVMDAVAFLFFRQASETRQRATELYDRLRRDKQLSESVSLVSSIEDTRVRSAMKAQIALHMSGLQPSPIDLSHFLSSQSVGSESGQAPRTTDLTPASTGTPASGRPLS